MDNYYDPYEKNYEASRPEPFSPEYAGFLVRFVASFIDGIIVGILILCILVGFVAVTAVVGGAMFASGSNDAAASGIFTGFCCMFVIAILSVQWLYFAFFESSAYMATPGKRLMGLMVTDEQGDRISFGKASVRYFLKMATNIILYLGYIVILLSSKKQGLYDIIAGTYVVKK